MVQLAGRGLLGFEHQFSHLLAGLNFQHFYLSEPTSEKWE